MDWNDLSKVTSMTYVRNNPHLPWDRQGLSKNKDITLDTIDYLDKHGDSLKGKWQWVYLSRTQPMRDVVGNPHLPWRVEGIYRNKGITMDYLGQVPGSHNNWASLSELLPMTDIRRNPDRPWDREFLSFNKGITLDDVLYLDLPNAIGEWDWAYLLRALPMVDIMRSLSLIDRYLDRGSLSFNRGITIDHIHEIDRYIGASGQWDGHALSQLIYLPGLIKCGDYLGIIWSRWGLSRNPSLTIEVITCMDTVSEGKWQWSNIAKIVPRDDLLHMMMTHQDMGISWIHMSMVAPISYVMSHMDMPWDREGLSRHEDLTLENMIDLDTHGHNVTGRWHRHYLSIFSGCITLDMIQYVDTYPSTTGTWWWSYIAKAIPITDIMDDGAYLMTKVSKIDISYNPSLTIEAIKRIDTLGLKGKWVWIAIAKIVPMDDILAYAISLL